MAVKHLALLALISTVAVQGSSLPKYVDNGLGLRLNMQFPLAEQYYVKLLDAEYIDEVRSLIQELGGSISRVMRNGQLLSVELMNQEAMQTLYDSGYIDLIEPVPTFERMSMDDKVPYGIKRVKAREVWNYKPGTNKEKFSTKGKNVIVCVIDDGIDPDHEDFQGLDIVNTNPDEEWQSCSTNDCNHGNHVIGTIAAQINDIGVVGVAPDVSIASVRVFNETHWSYPGGLIGALEECEDMKADIVSMSLGGPVATQSEKSAFTESPALCIAAAGNSNFGSDSFSFPASYHRVISVGAVDKDRNLASFSQRNDKVDIVAPGVDVLSTTYIKITPNLTSFPTSTPEQDIETYPVAALDGSEVGSTKAPLFNTFSNCTYSELDALDVDGKVCHCRSGFYTYDYMIWSAERNGCAAVIFSNSYGSLREGSVGSSEGLIGVITDEESGDALDAFPNDDSITVEVTFDNIDPYSNYEVFSGTSMACPHVSGVAALLMSAVPEAKNKQVQNCLFNTAKDLGPRKYDYGYGHGLVRADDALDCLIRRVCRSKPEVCENN